MKFDMKSLLKNKMVLYVVLFLAVTNVIGYLITDNMMAVVLFVLSGLATTYFSKNMIVVLVTSLVITSFFVGTKTAIRINKEGMKNKKDKKDKKDKSGEKKDKKEKENFDDDDDEDDIEDTQHEAAKVIRKNKPMKKRESDKMNSKEEDNMKTKDKKNKITIDHQSTLEEAYDNLERMLGSDGIRNMTKDTKKLAEKQKKLMANIKNMQPMLQNATKMLEGLDLEGMGNITKMMGNVTNLTKKMGLL